MSVIFMHWNPDVFTNPKKFDPDRWLEIDNTALNANFAPFSRGPRMCLGINLAWCELYLIFANIFRKLDLELASIHDECDTDYRTFKDFFIPVWEGSRLHVTVKGLRS